MLRLMLLRHAKAVGADERNDHARALAPRGREDSRALARMLAQDGGLSPERAMVSDARRTRETWGYLIESWPDLAQASVIFEPGLYHASAARILGEINKTPAADRTLLIIGHNPGLAELALLLTGYGDRYAWSRMAQKFPTCGLAVLDFDLGQWQAVDRRSGRLDRFVVPADAASSPC